MCSVVTFRAGLSNAHGRPEPWWPGDLGKDRSQWPGAGREAEESRPALAPGSRRQQEPCCPGGRYRTRAGRCLRAGSLHDQPSSGQGTGAGVPAGPEGSASCTPSAWQLCLCLGWLRQPSRSCRLLGTRGPFCLYSSGILGFPQTVTQSPVQ